jgi:hypothetical protein
LGQFPAQIPVYIAYYYACWQIFQRAIYIPIWITGLGGMMSLRIGIENGNEGRTIAWVFDHPGCFSYGEQTLDALKALPAAVENYNTWLKQHDLQKHTIPHEGSIQIEETWQVYHIDEKYAVSPAGYEIDGWFQDDWRPLTDVNIELGIALLNASRADLFSTVDSLSAEVLDKKFPGEHLTIAGILNHVGKADWWYLDRLGLAGPRHELPDNPVEQLRIVRQHLLSLLPALAGSTQVVGIDGEFWSPRKLLRRAVWHERDHAFHIQKILVELK